MLVQYGVRCDKRRVFQLLESLLVSTLGRTNTISEPDGPVGVGEGVGVADASALADSVLAEVEVLDSALTCAPPEQADRVSIIAAESAAIELRLNIIVVLFWCVVV